DISAERRSAIAAILTENAVATQSELVSRLHDLGFDATQSSVSRDFRALGVLKTPAGYTLPEPGPARHRDELTECAPFIRGVQAAGSHLAVLSTAIGAAQRVALALDRSGWPEIVGTLSGDDTIFIASADASHTRSLVQRIDQLITSRSP
ncbi:MAG: arginine repressor, partial [Pseudomonadota bacterium]